MFTKQVISKVPGKVEAESKKEKQGYIGDLALKTTPQLRELLDRQLKLLGNKSFIKKLADKGEKIKKLKDLIEEELKKRSPTENLSSMLSAMTLSGKEDLEGLEWAGRCAPGYMVPEQDADLSDDDQNPLGILASHSGAGFHQKKQRVLKPEEPLIKPSDIIDEDGGKSKDAEKEILEEYAKHLCEKLDSVNTKPNTSAKFLPFKTLVKPIKPVKPRKPGWEVTAATPPPSVHGDTKLVSLQESIRLQAEQQHQLKEVQMRHAAERLAASHSWAGLQLPREPGGYRDPGAASSDEEEGSEAEVHDEDDYPDTGGVVIYNIVDDVTTN